MPGYYLTESDQPQNLRKAIKAVKESNVTVCSDKLFLHFLNSKNSKEYARLVVGDKK